MPTIPIPIKTQGRSFNHLLEPEHHWAIRAAVGAERPLLVLGEPGVGKSQLALAAAILLARPLIRFTVDSNTEATDLLYRYDSIRRLSEAQVQGFSRNAIGADSQRGAPSSEPGTGYSALDPLAIDHFVSPGPLWWALDWESALAKSPAAKPEDTPTGWQLQRGVVILIDEIDKADSHVPNGLLEVLGENRFLPMGRNIPIRLTSGHSAPLVVITSNEDRVLPPAFVRRCVVLKINLPGGTATEIEQEPSKLVDYLERLGEAHFKECFNVKDGGETVYRIIARQLAEDRKLAIQQSLRPYPGPAEYLDILRAIRHITLEIRKKPNSFPEFEHTPFEEIPFRLANELSRFVFRKSSLRGE